MLGELLTSCSDKLDLSVKLFDPGVLLFQLHLIVDVAFLELVYLVGELSDAFLELPHDLFLLIRLFGQLSSFVFDFLELEKNLFALLILLLVVFHLFLQLMQSS